MSNDIAADVLIMLQIFYKNKKKLKTSIIPGRKFFDCLTNSEKMHTMYVKSAYT